MSLIFHHFVVSHLTWQLVLPRLAWSKASLNLLSLKSWTLNYFFKALVKVQIVPPLLVPTLLLLTMVRNEWRLYLVADGRHSKYSANSTTDVQGATPTNTDKSELATEPLDVSDISQKEVLIGGDTDDNRFEQVLSPLMSRSCQKMFEILTFTLQPSNPPLTLTRP